MLAPGLVCLSCLMPPHSHPHSHRLLQVVDNTKHPSWQEEFSLIVHCPEAQVGEEEQQGKVAGKACLPAVALRLAGRVLHATLHVLVPCRERMEAPFRLACQLDLIQAKPIAYRLISCAQVLQAKLLDYDTFDRDDEIGRCGIF